MISPMQCSTVQRRTTMNIIVTGASGLLGRAVSAEFKRNSWKVLGLANTRVRDDLVKIDLTDNDAVAKIVRKYKPHVIVHCAAERSTDKVECSPLYYEPLNVFVPIELAKLAYEIKAVFVFISSDYVFLGEESPYQETDLPNPKNSYGLMKAKAEVGVRNAYPGSFILRIPVIYGGEEDMRESAISCLINNVIPPRIVEVPNFEVRYPSHTKDIAGIIYELVQRKMQDPAMMGGVYHWCGLEPFTKFEMARIIAEKFGRAHDHMIPLDFPAAGTPRPMNCQLSCQKIEDLGIGRHTTFAEGIEEFRRFFE